MNPNTTPVQHKLRWHDMLFLGMGIPGAAFNVFVYTLAAVGALVGMFLWTLAASIALLQNQIWFRMAEMFPEKRGGIAMFSAEGWKDKLFLVAPIAAFAYWMAWSATNAVVSVLAVELVHQQWFPKLHWTIGIGLWEITVTQLAAIMILAIFSLLNLRGIETALGFAKLSGILLLIPIVVCLLAPLFSADWDVQHFVGTANTTDWSWADPRLLLAWLFTINYTVYATEMCSAFTPEYRSIRDMKTAINTLSIFSLIVFIIVPIGLGGIVDSSNFLNDPIVNIVIAFEKLLPIPGISSIIIAIVVSNLLVAVNAGVADAGRALSSGSEEGFNLRQFAELNQYDMPQKAIIFSFVINTLLIMTAASPISIIASANFGYMLAMALGIGAFLILSPANNAKNKKIWTIIATCLLLYNLTILTVGALSFKLTGYGGIKELLIGIGVILFSLILFGYRRLVQDRFLG